MNKWGLITTISYIKPTNHLRVHYQLASLDRHRLSGVVIQMNLESVEGHYHHQIIRAIRLPVFQINYHQMPLISYFKIYISRNN